MWKLLNGRLIHMTDESRVKFRTNISQSVIESLKKLAADNDTHVNYLIESGVKAVLADGNITFNKHMRPTDRIQYKTTYDKELLIQLKEFAKNHDLYINDVIEFSIQHIDIKQSKDMSYRYRVE